MRFNALLLASLGLIACGDNPADAGGPTQSALIRGVLQPADPGDPTGVWQGEEVVMLLDADGGVDCEVYSDLEGARTDDICPDCWLSVEISSMIQVNDTTCPIDGTALKVGQVLSFSPGTDGPVRTGQNGEGTVWVDGEGVGPQMVGTGLYQEAELSWQRAVRVRDGQIVDDLPFRDLQLKDELQ
ncbi:MAG: hypothetical protein KTR31_22540 [Myxococcales bacterium]|nr:hypothetical protein [Myxococcales bacterium]